MTGLRIGEALRLDRDDVDLVGGVLRIRESKFGKSREVPLHPSTVEALAAYGRRRDQLCRHRRDAAFFVSTAGTRLLYCNAHLAWLDLVRRAGLQPRSARCRPRPHDLRHSFAVRTLLGWYRDGVDVARAAAAAVDLPRPRRPGQHLLVSVGRARAARPRRRPPRHRSTGARP